jgi:hypothetical protein
MKIADFGERQKTQMKISYNQKTPVKESDPWPVWFFVAYSILIAFLLQLTGNLVLEFLSVQKAGF